MRFSFTAAPSETLSAGLYSQNAFISLETPEGQTLAEKPVTLSIEVPSAAVMGLKGEFRRTGGTATIDLGELTQGVRQLRTTLYVLSTAGYSVSVSSENRGRLRQGASEWYVPYALALGDRDMDLGRGGRLDVISRRARLDDYPLTISVGPTAGKRAGDAVVHEQGHQSCAHGQTGQVDTTVIDRIRAEPNVVDAIKNAFHIGLIFVTTDLPNTPDTTTGKDFVVMAQEDPMQQ